MPNYPAQIDTTQSLPTVTDNATAIRGAVINRLRDAIISVETALGTSPGGVYSSVKNRFDTLESIVNNFENISLAGDLGGTNNSPIVVGLQTYPVSSEAPEFLDTLLWDGAAWSPRAITFTGGDLSGEFPSPVVSSLHGRPVSDAAPSPFNVLGWSGSAWVPQVASYSNVVGGDLSGSLPNPTVSSIQGNPISNLDPSVSEVLTWSGSSWTPTALPAAGAGLTFSSNTYNIGENPDNSITVNSDNIQINTSFYTPFPINGKLAQRDPTYGFIHLNDTSGSARYGGSILITEPTVFSISQSGRTSDAACKDITITPQAPYSSATSTNRLPGNVIINLSAAVGGLATSDSGKVSIKFGGNEYTRFEAHPLSNTGKITFPTAGNLTASTDLSLTGSNSASLNSNTSVGMFAPSVNIDGSDLNVSLAGNATIGADNAITINGTDFYINGSGGDFQISSSAGIQMYSSFISLNNTTPGNDVTFGPSDNGTADGEGLTVTAGNAAAGSGIGGNLNLKAGTGSNFNGNIGINMDAPAGNTGPGHFTVYLADTNAAPTTNPTGSTAFYSTSGNFKIRSGAGNIVTLGNKPSVTGSRGGNAALANLLSVLATAGIITDGTSA